MTEQACPIPAAGSQITIPVCLPDTWGQVLHGLLMLPTDPAFWDIAATPAEVEAAVQIAQNIVCDVMGPDCTCVAPAGSFTETNWDFTVSEQGWTPASEFDHGYWQDGAWHASIFQVNANRWDMRLQIRKTYGSAVRPRDLRATCYIQDEATTHIGPSYANVNCGDSFPLFQGEVQFGGDLFGWHTGPMNPRCVAYTESGITFLEIGLYATFALDPSGVVDYRCTAAYFGHFA